MVDNDTFFEDNVVKNMLSDQDKHAFDVIKLKKALALANAEKAVLKHELAESSYSNFILRLTITYDLKENDSITEQGEIVRSTDTTENKGTE